MQPFSQKIVAVANVLVLTCLFYLFIFVLYIYLFIYFNTKKQRRKVKTDTITHRTQKKALEKITGTLNLIFGSTPFGKKLLKSIASCNHEWVSYTSLLEFWTTLLLQTAPGQSDLKDAFAQLLFWDLSTGVLWDSDLDSLLAISELSSALFITISECFLKCVSDYCPTGRPMTSGGDTGHYAVPQNSLVIIRFHNTVHTVKTSSARSSKATPKHILTSTMFDCRDCVLFFEGLIYFSVNSAMMSFAKKLYFCLICPQYVLPEGLWFCQISFAVVFSWVSLFIQTVTDSASWHWCTLCLQMWICMKVNQGSLSTIQTIFCCNFSFIWFFHPRPRRWVTVSWAVNLLMILRTVHTGTLRSLEMDL